MSPEMLGLIKMVVALPRMLAIDPVLLAREYLSEANQEFYDTFIAAVESDDD